MNFFEILYAQKNGAALPANFFDLLFAKSFTPAIEWGEYDGTLPAQFNANGSVLADYRVYGAAGGVGDDSGTEYGYEVDMSVSDGTTSTTTPVYIGDTPLGEDEYVSFEEQKVYRRTEQLWDYEKITVTVGERYGIIVPNGQYSIRNDTKRTIYVVRDPGISGENVMVACEANSTTTLTAQSLQTSDIRFYIGGTDTLQSGVTIVAGSTVPSVEIPYLQSTDPPVPLPALPTVDGTNIVDYAGQSAAPSRFYAKYQRK